MKAAEDAHGLAGANPGAGSLKAGPGTASCQPGAGRGRARRGRREAAGTAASTAGKMRTFKAL